MRLFMHIVFCTWGYEPYHWLFELSFLSFLYPIILAYIVSCALRLPWGHGIGYQLWYSLLGQAFKIWLMCKHHHVLLSRECFSDVWSWFIMDVEDCLILWQMRGVVWLPILLYIRCHTEAYPLSIKIASLTLVFILFHDNGYWFWLFDFFMIFSGIASQVIRLDLHFLISLLSLMELP